MIHFCIMSGDEYTMISGPRTRAAFVSDLRGNGKTEVQDAIAQTEMSVVSEGCKIVDDEVHEVILRIEQFNITLTAL